MDESKYQQKTLEKKHPIIWVIYQKNPEIYLFKLKNPDNVHFCRIEHHSSTLQMRQIEKCGIEHW
jgi:hypothetical protein